jgi:hypothetical protein
MRTGLYIPQRAIVEKDLLGKITTDAWLLLDYLRRWVTCKNVKKAQVRGREFFWIKYRQACRELPILFPNGPILRTQLNKMVRLVASLRKYGLIDSVRSGSRCYIHITPTAHELYAKPTMERGSRVDEHSVTSVHDGADMEKYDGPVMRNGDGNKEEPYREERHYTQNSYSDEELESVKRRLETIFPKRNWSSKEIDFLKVQMPIPEWEMKLILRLYQLPGPQSTFLPATKLPGHEFWLSRRRQTMKTLLENWSDEVTRGLFFFRTPYGVGEAQRRGWDLTEMRWDGKP